MNLAQAAETASNGAEWAVISAWVAAAGALSSVVATIWVSHKRLEHESQESDKRLAHEERMMDKRLVHEASVHAERLVDADAQAAKEAAADAYARAFRVLLSIDSTVVYSHKDDLEAGRGYSPAQLAHDVMEELALVTATGWNDAVRQTARQLELALDQLVRTGYESAACLWMRRIANPRHWEASALSQVAAELSGAVIPVPSGPVSL